MKYLIYFSFFFINFLSCKKKEEKSKQYYFTRNESYTGTQNISQISATINIQDADSGILIEIKMNEGNPQLKYPLHFHKKDNSTSYGFSSSAIIDFPDINGNGNLVQFSNQFTFKEFTETFDGIFVMHDPTNNKNLIESLVLLGKIGKIDD